MKASVHQEYGPAEVLHLQEVPQPSVGDTDVLIQVHAAGVDPGVWIFLTGRPYAVRLASGLRRPRVQIRGLDVAGVVTAVGAKVTRFHPGDEVYGTCFSGSYAEFALAKEKQLFAKPSNLSFIQAAATAVSGVTALKSLRDSRIQAGQRVLITGAGGGVGSFAVQIAKASGAHVTGVCSAAKADLVRSLGADDVIDYARDEIDRAGAVFDIVLDLAGSRSLALLRRAATPHGTIALVGGGHAKGRVLGGFGRQMAAPLISLFMRQRLLGVTALVRQAELAELTGLIESGQVVPAVGSTYPLAEAAAAIRDHAASRSGGKVVVTIP